MSLTINSGMLLREGNIDYRSFPTTFNGVSTGLLGPSPGLVTATTSGISITFTFTTPSYCRIMNLDTTNYVTVGHYAGSTFYPLMEVLPGQSYVIKLARTITNELRVKADTASCKVLVEGFGT